MIGGGDDDGGAAVPAAVPVAPPAFGPRNRAVPPNMAAMPPVLLPPLAFEEEVGKDGADDGVLVGLVPLNNLKGARGPKGEELTVFALAAGVVVDVADQNRAAGVMGFAFASASAFAFSAAARSCSCTASSDEVGEEERGAGTSASLLLLLTLN